MKKIMFLTNHLQYSDGVAKALLNLTNNMDLTKYDITISALFKVDNKFINLFDKRIHIENVFKIYFKGFSKLLYFFPYKILINKIFTQQYDIIVAYQRGLATKLLSNKKISTPKIVFMHGYDIKSQKYHKNFDKVVCVSKNASIDYKKIFCKPEIVDYCNNIINNKDILEKSKFNTKYDFLKQIQEIKFCFVGRISEEKGLNRIIKIFHKLNQEKYNFKYLIIGDGKQIVELKKMVNNYGLNDKIIFCGFQKNPYSILNLCDCYVCSSYGEGLSTSCIEASILNKHIISTKVSGAVEIIQNPDIGIICENNEEDLYIKIKGYLDGNFPIKLWDNNFDKANIKWDKKILINKFEKIIDEVIML